VAQPKGYFIFTPADGGKPIEGETMKCCHCQETFVVVKGSGRLRGFCTKCMRVTCGKSECLRCSPWEKQIERIERGLSPEL
jgi:hypothetical protein